MNLEKKVLRRNQTMESLHPSAFVAEHSALLQAANNEGS